VGTPEAAEHRHLAHDVPSVGAFKIDPLPT
jgi:hypothetical protein